MLLKLQSGAAGRLLLLAALALLLSSACGAAPKLTGTDLGARPAPNFTLTDQTGRQVSLSELRGRPVVLTFLYTSCPDTCPLITTKLNAVQGKLGADGSKVALLSVSTDPKRDTVQAAREYLRARAALESQIYLTGSSEALSPVWKAYGIHVANDPPGPDGSYEVTHTPALYVIDKQGRERVLLREDFDVDALARDLKTLSRE